MYFHIGLSSNPIPHPKQSNLLLKVPIKPFSILFLKVLMKFRFTRWPILYKIKFGQFHSNYSYSIVLRE